MSLIIDFLKLFKCVVRVYLGGRETGMAQKLLYRIEISAIIKQVRGKGMPENMRALLFNGGNHGKVSGDYVVNSLVIHFITPVSDKEPSSLETLPITRFNV